MDCSQRFRQLFRPVAYARTETAAAGRPWPAAIMAIMIIRSGERCQSSCRAPRARSRWRGRPSSREGSRSAAPAVRRAGPAAAPMTIRAGRSPPQCRPSIRLDGAARVGGQRARKIIIGQAARVAGRGYDRAWTTSRGYAPHLAVRAVRRRRGRPARAGRPPRMVPGQPSGERAPPRRSGRPRRAIDPGSARRGGHTPACRWCRFVNRPPRPSWQSPTLVAMTW